MAKTPPSQGKGDKPRPVNGPKYRANWETIFRPKTTPKKRRKPKPPTILTTCMGARDGECIHKLCPQLRDNEPYATGRHCPLDHGNYEY